MAPVQLSQREVLSRVVVRSLPAFRVAGYGLIIMALLDVGGILLRLKTLERGVLFQTAGMIIERSPVPLLGFLMVVFGAGYLRQKREHLMVGAVRWLSLLYGICLWLLVPLILVITLRLNYLINPSVLAQAEPQLLRLEQVEGQIKTVEGDELKQLFLSWQQQPDASPDRHLVSEPEKFRTQVLDEVQQSRQNLRAQMKQVESDRRLDLLTNAVKWVMTAIVAGFVMVYLWYLSSIMAHD